MEIYVFTLCNRWDRSIGFLVKITPQLLFVDALESTAANCLGYTGVYKTRIRSYLYLLFIPHSGMGLVRLTL